MSHLCASLESRYMLLLRACLSRNLSAGPWGAALFVLPVTLSRRALSLTRSCPETVEHGVQVLTDERCHLGNHLGELLLSDLLHHLGGAPTRGARMPCSRLTPATPSTHGTA